jgi:hypothetical protein
MVLCMPMPLSLSGTLAVLGDEKWASKASSEEKACTKPSANPVADPPWCKQPTRIIRGLRATLRPRYKSLAQGTCEFRSDF